MPLLYLIRSWAVDIKTKLYIWTEQQMVYFFRIVLNSFVKELYQILIILKSKELICITISNNLKSIARLFIVFQLKVFCYIIKVWEFYITFILFEQFTMFLDSFSWYFLWITFPRWANKFMFICGIKLLCHNLTLFTE